MDAGDVVEQAAVVEVALVDVAVLEVGEQCGAQLLGQRQAAGRAELSRVAVQGAEDVGGAE